jgi:hypothetical protein
VPTSKLLRFPEGPYMLWNIAVGLTILLAFGSVLFALWTDREPSEREGRAQLER